MNVMVYNKYKDLLMGLNIEVMKSLEGVFNVDEIIDTFTNFYYDKMILDITAIRDYQNTDNLQKLAMNINMENVIILLDSNSNGDEQAYLSKLISLGIYNFTKNAEGINYLLVHPHTYRDVVNIHNIDDMVPNGNMPQQVNMADPSLAPIANQNNVSNVTNSRLRIIGFINATTHAGATSLIYMLKKTIESSRNVTAIEVDKVDFLYFNDKSLISVTSAELPKELMKHQNSDIILVDLNDYADIDICSEIYYLVEPSTIMVNKMLKKNKDIFNILKSKNVVLNKCVLSHGDIATFEYETKLSVLFCIPPVDERQSVIDAVRKFASKIKL